jgi:hypothetical protein
MKRQAIHHGQALIRNSLLCLPISANNKQLAKIALFALKTQVDFTYSLAFCESVASHRRMLFSKQYLAGIAFP